TYSLSLGEEEVTIPGVEGKPFDDAQLALEELGLAVKFTEQSSNTVPQNVVISQDRQAGSKVAKGTTVTLTVSTGAEMKTVPNVIGLSATNAKATLTAAGFVVEIEEVSGTASNRVIDQSIDAGSEAAVGTTIKISVDTQMQSIRPDDPRPGTPGQNTDEDDDIFNPFGDQPIGDLNH
ncbi:MAG: PASTA domain-containing protein, partial [Coriobacteriia bacterium]|nr:PASTA domain-containing protein [Coriobacteriia bacterium]